MDLKNCEVIANYSDITHEEWLQLRKTGIGGSEAGGVMEVSKYQSPFSICMEKTGRVKPDDLSDNEAVWYGNWMENKIREELVEPFILDTLGLSVEVIAPTCMYRSKEHEFGIVNPDGFIKIIEHDKASDIVRVGEEDWFYTIPYKLVGLEIKTGSSYVLKDWKDDKVPQSYYAQVQHYMAGTGLDEWWVFGLIGNKRLLRIVKRNEEYINDLIEREKQLWDLIQKNDPLYFPLPSGMSIDEDYIYQAGLNDDGIVSDLSEIDDSITAYKTLNDKANKYKAACEGLKQEILWKMGDAVKGESYRWSTKFTKSNYRRLDQDALKQDHPEILKKYTKTTESGRLTVKEL